MKDRSPDQTAVSISLPKDLLARIDARAKSLGMPRSRYLALLAKTDVEQGGGLVLRPEPHPEALAPVDIVAEVAEFLELAVPALADFEERQKAAQDSGATLSEPVESPVENRFWNEFLREREEILKLKWIASKHAGHDIGIREAIRRWLQHRPLWKAALSSVAPQP